MTTVSIGGCARDLGERTAITSYGGVRDRCRDHDQVVQRRTGRELVAADEGAPVPVVEAGPRRSPAQVWARTPPVRRAWRCMGVPSAGTGGRAPRAPSSGPSGTGRAVAFESQPRTARIRGRHAFASLVPLGYTRLHSSGSLDGSWTDDVDKTESGALERAPDLR